MLYTNEAIHRAEVNVSEILESHRVPDIYSWRINNVGKLVPEKDNTPIENIIVTNNPVAKTELQAFMKIQEKAPLMEEGDYVLWISLTHPIYYPDTSKIIITKKTNGTLLNTSINTNWEVTDGILIARELASLSNLDPNIFKSATDVRGNPIFINKDKEEGLGHAIKNMIDKKSIEMMQNGEAIRIKEKYVKYYLAGRRVRYGNNSLSCPVKMDGPSAFQVFSGEDQYGSLEFECPNPDCKKTNRREPGKLLSHCKHCGCDVRCG